MSCQSHLPPRKIYRASPYRFLESRQAQLAYNIQRLTSVTRHPLLAPLGDPRWSIKMYKACHDSTHVSYVGQTDGIWALEFKSLGMTIFRTRVRSNYLSVAGP